MVPQFRAWHKKLKKMADVQHIVEMQYICAESIPLYFNEKRELCLDRKKMWSIEDIELMQCTGFKDCEGNDIYDGDIVLDMGPCIENMIVHSSDYGWLITMDGDPESVADWSHMLRVIGNIYENSERLEQE